jgi:hypothetical protein
MIYVKGKKSIDNWKMHMMTIVEFSKARIRKFLVMYRYSTDNMNFQFCYLYEFMNTFK